jgi:DNA-directed RNA polymerase subunit K/omega
VKVKALPMSDLLKKYDDIYTAAVIISKRARQIIDQRVIPIEENEDVEDSIQFIEPEIVIEDIDKPMVVALEEYLTGELEWRKPEEDEPESDEA